MNDAVRLPADAVRKMHLLTSGVFVPTGTTRPQQDRPVEIVRPAADTEPGDTQRLTFDVNEVTQYSPEETWALYSAAIAIKVEQEYGGISSGHLNSAIEKLRQMMGVPDDAHAHHINSAREYIKSLMDDGQSAEALTT